MSFMRETLYCGLLISTWQNSKIMATPTKIVPKNPVFTGEVCLCCKINFLISGRRKYLVTDSIKAKSKSAELLIQQHFQINIDFLDTAYKEIRICKPCKSTQLNMEITILQKH